jgi:DNA sulfur modification protein DndD
LFPPKSAAVGLEFEYGLGGRLHIFNIERSWDCSGTAVTTSLTITRDEAQLDHLERTHADEFLRDLIPRGVSQLFFFDGEKIQEMAQAADDDLALTDAIKGLLGLDLIGRLHSDLGIYAAKLHGSKAPKALKKELDDIDKTLKQLQADRLKLVGSLDRCQSRVDRLTQDIIRAKQKLMRVGGVFANDRAGLEAEESRLTDVIESLEQQFRDLCSELLPFTFATQLCIDLDKQLDSEAILQQWKALQELVQLRVAETKRNLEGVLFPQGASPVESNLRQLIVDRVRGILDTLSERPCDLPAVPLLHRLSVDDHKRLSGALRRVVEDLPAQLSILEVELESHTRRRAEISASAKKIPEDDVLEPLVEQLNDLHKKLGEAEAERNQRKQELGSLDHQIEVHQRLRRRKEEELGNSQAGSERRQLVSQVQSVLDDYSRELTKAKVAELSEAVGDCFGQLWRKGDVLRGIRIDPDTCSVVLLDRHEQIIPKERLSAGEKQIYAISMLWALARVSGRLLPMVIDTPLARLDSKHRHHLVTRYFPHVSHQVVILSTDTEIDQTYFHELNSATSHAYHLSFDEAESHTVVEPGYFWARKEAEVLT